MTWLKFIELIKFPLKYLFKKIAKQLDHFNSKARSDACPPGNQAFTGSIPGPAYSFVEIWS